MNQTSNKIRINEIFYSLQGEGVWTGTPVIFIRFSGCNRKCSFCDTQHEQYTEMSIDEILNAILKYAPCKRVVITGGEPMKQRDGLHSLSSKLACVGYIVHLETNGDYEVDPSDFDWLTVSPKGEEWKQKIGDEIKIVYTGQTQDELEKYLEMSDDVHFIHHFLQPCYRDDGSNVAEVVEFIKLDPRWRLSLQTHKLIGMR